MKNKKGTLFVVSAPSGAGKSSLVAAVLSKWSHNEHPIERVITYTSKTARSNEIDGKDYHFLSQELFEKRIEEGFFLEWSTAYGAYYGSPRYILEQIMHGKSYILIIDRIGAQQLLKHTSDVVLIWIYTETIQILQNRLIARATENKSVIEYRLAQACQEIELERQNELYNYHILNDDFNDAKEKLFSVFLTEIKKNLGK